MAWKKMSQEEKKEYSKKKVKDFQKQVIDNLINIVQEGTDEKWHKPWNGSFQSLPYNPQTGHRYSGSNMVSLMLLQFLNSHDPRVMTLKQAQEKYGEDVHVKKDEKATYLLRPSLFYVLDDSSTASLKKVAKEVHEYVKDFDEDKEFNIADQNLINRIYEMQENDHLSSQDINLVATKIFGYEQKISYRTYPVFFADQLVNVPDIKEELGTTEQKWDNNHLVENFLQASGADILHKPIDRAFYRKSEDTINMPFKDDFTGEKDEVNGIPEKEIAAAKYYATVLHEFMHWTGHEDRDNRETLVKPSDNLSKKKKKKEEYYAQDELFAESGSLMLSMYLDMPVNMDQHVAYLTGWKEKLDMIKGQTSENQQKDIENHYKELYDAVVSSSKYIEVIQDFIDCKQPSKTWFPDKANWEHLSRELVLVDTRDDIPSIFYDKDKNIDWENVSQGCNMTENFVTAHYDLLNADSLKDNKFLKDMEFTCLGISDEDIDSIFDDLEEKSHFNDQDLQEELATLEDDLESDEFSEEAFNVNVTPR